MSVIDKAISSDKLLKWIENSPLADGFWLGTGAVVAFDNLKDVINDGQFAISFEQVVEELRKHYQLCIYTVNEHWCIQLFDHDIAANDNVSCIYETSSLKLNDTLQEAFKWMVEHQRNI